jgi:hypothetical protein
MITLANPTPPLNCSQDGVAGDGEPKKGEVIYSDEEGEEEDEDGQPVVSKKKQKKLAVRPPVRFVRVCGRHLD